ncbi:MAG: hypothetical protein M3203_10465, partial [Actinomycetota bacterium]|nr:hypothetical protein [Actinomycetota bacterium]
GGGGGPGGGGGGGVGGLAHIFSKHLRPVSFLGTPCEGGGKMNAMATTAAELESWVREELGLDDAQSVEITEMPGTDPRCSPIVTQVAVGPAEDAEGYAFHIERPLAELVRMDLVAALAFGGGH